MKKILNKILLAGICSVFFTTACVEKFAVGDAFLEKAPGVDVNIDTVFSSAEYTRNFLWSECITDLDILKTDVLRVNYPSL